MKRFNGICIVTQDVRRLSDYYQNVLQELDVPFVKLPTTQPWGLQSVWRRDPDGNMVNFYAGVVINKEKA